MSISILFTSSVLWLVHTFYKMHCLPNSQHLPPGMASVSSSCVPHPELEIHHHRSLCLSINRELPPYQHCKSIFFMIFFLSCRTGHKVLCGPPLLLFLVLTFTEIANTGNPSELITHVQIQPVSKRPHFLEDFVCFRVCLGNSQQILCLILSHCFTACSQMLNGLQRAG